jgi:hypothetical protein
MRTLGMILFVSCLFVVAMTGCSQKANETVVLAQYSMDTMEGVITTTGTGIDEATTSDGGGSLHVSATQPTTVTLFETGDIDVENARLMYRAKVRTQNVDGKVYLEMWCHFPDKGEYFSRGLQSAMSGSQEWTSQETPFFLKKGENPDNVKLNLVVDGAGEAWIDDVQLVKAASN